MGPIELINLVAGEMGQFLHHKKFAQTFPCSHPKGFEYARYSDSNDRTKIPLYGAHLIMIRLFDSVVFLHFSLWLAFSLYPAFLF